MNNVKVIISRYNEKLDWLEEEPFCNFQFIVYNKGDNDDFNKTNVIQVVELPNVGKCDHTYLYHIVNNFENLDDILVFFPGSLNISSKKEKAVEILERIKLNNFQNAVFIGDYSPNILRQFYNFTINNYYSAFPDNFEKNSSNEVLPSSIRPFGKWYLHNFGNIIVNYYTYQGIFSVHKNDITQNPKYRYEKLLSQLGLNISPEVGHYVERSWGAIFYPMKNTKILISGKPKTSRARNFLRRPPRFVQYNKIKKSLFIFRRKKIFYIK
jgi:hypothetical protein